MGQSDNAYSSLISFSISVCSVAWCQRLCMLSKITRSMSVRFLGCMMTIESALRDSNSKHHPFTEPVRVSLPLPTDVERGRTLSRSRHRTVARTSHEGSTSPRNNKPRPKSSRNVYDDATGSDSEALTLCATVKPGYDLSNHSRTPVIIPSTPYTKMIASKSDSRSDSQSDHQHVNRPIKEPLPLSRKNGRVSRHSKSDSKSDSQNDYQHANKPNNESLYLPTDIEPASLHSKSDYQLITSTSFESPENHNSDIYGLSNGLHETGTDSNRKLPPASIVDGYDPYNYMCTPLTSSPRPSTKVIISKTDSTSHYPHTTKPIADEPSLRSSTKPASSRRTSDSIAGNGPSKPETKLARKPPQADLASSYDPYHYTHQPTITSSVPYTKVTVSKRVSQSDPKSPTQPPPPPPQQAALISPTAAAARAAWLRQQQQQPQLRNATEPAHRHVAIVADGKAANTAPRKKASMTGLGLRKKISDVFRHRR